ncbi:fungal-specific transcription factor domain-containing protein [Leptodontidium sp. 2 PMI_412]|nr:fungal-specific transcription factor domain-containing protein [Leptodontidium sp. 2 PMI_412]
MGNLGIAECGKGNSEVYRRSSTASFMRQLRNAVKEKVQTPEQQAGHNRGEFQGSREPYREALRPRYCPSSILQHCVLPPRHLADTMLKYFWMQGHALYPFLSKATFLTAYEYLWRGKRVLSDQIMTDCILNVIFAIMTADMYFKRAMQLLQIEILGSGSLQLIQPHLVMGMYLQSTDTPHRCWVMIGIAIRVAQGLGLHLRETTGRMQRQTDRELARRIWHGCILMDRILSMTLGQPLMIGRAISESVPLPACIDEAYLSSDPGREGVQPSNIPSNMEFFRLTLKLYNILEDILSTFYPSGVSDQLTYKKDNCTSEEIHCLDLNAILRIDKLLSEWMASIPPHLVSRPPAINPEIDEGFLRQANVLKLRYLHLQILLFRPLQRSGGSELEMPLQLAIALPFANKCVLAAQEIVEITHSHQRNNGSFEPLPAWWYKVFYVYSAATALIAARIYRPLHCTISDISIKSSWLRCFEVLKSHTEVSKSARCCVAALQFLDKNIVVAPDQTAHAPRQQSNTAPPGNTQQVSLGTAFITQQDVANFYPRLSSLNSVIISTTRT